VLESSIKKIFVISAVNFVEGGPVTVLRDCVSAALSTLSKEWKIVVLVHDRSLIEDNPRLVIYEFPRAKTSWVIRLYYEWYKFNQLSKALRPTFWFSLHDITPHVLAEGQAVYCHNPAPFTSISLREAWLEPKILLFNLFYRYLYGFGITRNKFVIVQQDWLRSRFQKMFGISNVAVAYPQVARISQSQDLHERNNNCVFIYPALPRVLKNIELICEAVRILNSQGIVGFSVYLTIDGKENRYARWLYKKYSLLPEISFIGLQNQQQMIERYKQSDCLLFSSKIETWGLPMSEAKSYEMPMIVADLPYAHEAIGSYDRVRFFNAKDIGALAELMKAFVQGNLQWHKVEEKSLKPDFVDNWQSLIKLLTQDKK
jgi:glycosyltransferase involved in cell wall biosynthesis